MTHWGVSNVSQWFTNPTSIHGNAGSIPGLSQQVMDPVLPWAVMYITDKAWIWCFCGSSVGQQLQLWFNPCLGTSICHRGGPKKQKKKKNHRWWHWFLNLNQQRMCPKWTKTVSSTYRCKLVLLAKASEHTTISYFQEIILKHMETLHSGRFLYMSSKILFPGFF